MSNRFAIQALNPAVDSQISYQHSFRVITDKKSPRFGETRDPVEISYVIPSWDSLGEFPRDCLNLIQFAIRELTLKKFKENSENWDYIPSSDELSIPNLSAYLTEEKSRRGKLWTQKNLQDFKEFFSPLFSQIGKSAGFIQTFFALAEIKFISLASSENIPKAQKLLDLISSNSEILDAMENSANEIQLGIYAEIIDLLEEICSGKIKNSVANLDNLD